MRVCVGCCCSFYGILDNIVWVLQSVSGSPLTIHGAGTQKRQFTYVGDVAQVIAQAAFLKQREFHVINIGSDEINSVSELVAEVEAVSGKALDVARSGDRTGAYHVQVCLHLPGLSKLVLGQDLSLVPLCHRVVQLLASLPLSDRLCMCLIVRKAVLV